MLQLLITIGFLVLSYGQYGYMQSDYIVGGRETTIQEHPYQVALLLYGSFICGGSLIAHNLVLTAAHCTTSLEPSSLSVRIGSDYANSGGTVVEASEVYIHPKYLKSDGGDYDVSIIVLKRYLRTSKYISIIKIPEVNEEVPLNALAAATGWGATEEDGNIANKLQIVEVPKISNEECKKMYASVGDSITARTVCFGYKEGAKDACQGDSGGPLVWNGVQVGTVSWGIGCARESNPGVYADLANPEIHKYIESFLKRN